jgi:hypothetical protein
MAKRSRATSDYFRDIEGLYNSMEQIEEALVDLANHNLELLPLGYSYLDLLEWLRQKNYIIKENHKFRIKIK